MITPNQIDEWVHEVEERPASAPLIIQYIAGRLRDLTKRNEELLAENIALHSGRKVEEYESRIANLEYQLEILRRQIGGADPFNLTSPANETISVIAYNPKGMALRLELAAASLDDHRVAARLSDPSSGGPPRLLVTNPMEELLFVFDSGRTVSLPVSEITAIDPGQVDWRKAYLVEPHGGEELACVTPVGKMTLFDYCVQISRRGCAKKMMKTSFESHVSKSFVGAGVKGKPDKTCDLTLCNKEDQIVLSSREGFLLCTEVSQLPYTIEDVLKLSATDFITSSFVLGNKPSLLIMTQNGKAIHRETKWLEKTNSFKSRGQAIFSQSRREAGIRIAGASTVDEKDWGIALNSDGTIELAKVAELLAAGSFPCDASEPNILEFTVFSIPEKIS